MSKRAGSMPVERSASRTAVTTIAGGGENCWGKDGVSSVDGAHLASRAAAEQVTQRLLRTTVVENANVSSHEHAGCATAMPLVLPPGSSEALKVWLSVQRLCGSNGMI